MLTSTCNHFLTIALVALFVSQKPAGIGRASKNLGSQFPFSFTVRLQFYFYAGVGVADFKKEEVYDYNRVPHNM